MRYCREPAKKDCLKKKKQPVRRNKLNVDNEKVMKTIMIIVITKTCHLEN